MPPSAIPSSVRRVISSSPRRRRNSSTGAGGNFGALPHPPQLRVEALAERALRVREQRAGERLARRRQVRARADVLGQVAPRPVDLAALVAPRLRHTEQHLLERGQPVPGLRREVRAAEERLARRRQEDRHRPAAAAGQRDDGVHVDRVEVRPLFAVDLDGDEVLVQDACGQLVLEGLPLHHVAPVARGVADREHDRAVLVTRTGEGLVAPRVPVDRVVLVLQEIRRRLVGEAVHLRHRRTPSTPSVTAAAIPKASSSAAQTWCSKNRPPK